MKYGLRFEQEFGDSLAKMGCDIRSNSILDQSEKTDILIVRLDCIILRDPVKVQVTLRTNNRLKLEEFVAARARDIGLSVYVEVDEGCPPAHAALDLKRALQPLIDHKGALRGCHVLTVGRDGSRFTPVSADQLNGRPRPHHRGLVIKRDGTGFEILSERGGIFHAYPADIIDPTLRQALSLLPRNRRLMDKVRVSFEPDESGGVREARAVRQLRE